MVFKKVKSFVFCQLRLKSLSGKSPTAATGSTGFKCRSSPRTESHQRKQVDHQSRAHSLVTPYIVLVPEATVLSTGSSWRGCPVLEHVAVKWIPNSCTVTREHAHLDKEGGVKIDCFTYNAKFDDVPTAGTLTFSVQESS